MANRPKKVERLQAQKHAEQESESTQPPNETNEQPKQEADSAAQSETLEE